MTRGCIIGLVLTVAGCGVQASREAVRRAASNVSAKQTPVALTTGSVDTEGALPIGNDRKIIYEAEIRIVVDDFSVMETAVSRLTKEHDGYLANVSIDRTSGEQRSGRWEARIPVRQFDGYMQAISELGVPENRSQTAQDVTEEYVDLEARIANKKRLEERILMLLERAEGSIKDVIEVENELGRVRGEIEQMEGRLRYLMNRTQLTTVVVFAREQRDYVPPKSPTLSARIASAWGNSLLSLRNVGEAVAVAIVFAIPWFVVFAVIALPLWLFVRRNNRLRNGNPNKPLRAEADDASK